MSERVLSAVLCLVAIGLIAEPALSQFIGADGARGAALSGFIRSPRFGKGLSGQTLILGQNFFTDSLVLTERFPRQLEAVARDIGLNAGPDGNYQIEQPQPLNPGPDRRQIAYGWRSRLSIMFGAVCWAVGVGVGFVGCRWLRPGFYVRFALAWSVMIGLVIVGLHFFVYLCPLSYADRAADLPFWIRLGCGL